VLRRPIESTLTPAIRVVEPRPPAEREGPIERREHQLAIDPRPRGPADHPTRIEIEHHGQVEPPLARGEIGEIGRPGLIGRRHRKRLIEPVGRNGEGMIAVRRQPESPARHPLQPGRPQEPRDPLPADREPLLLEIPENSRTPVGPLPAPMARRDPDLQLQIPHRTGTGLPPAPGVVAAP